MTRLDAALVATLAAACLISLLSFGVRSAFGLFTEPLTRDLGVSRELYAVAIAVQNLTWGIAQPLAGIAADRYGARLVLLSGSLLYAAGIAWLSVAPDGLQVVLGAGVLVGLGMGGASYVTVLAALGRAMPDDRRSWALGLGAAAGSLGQFVVLPLTQAIIDVGGWRQGAMALAGGIAACLVASLFVRGDKAAPLAGTPGPTGIREMVSLAVRCRSYVLLVCSFFVCGFQLAFITAHFPAYLADHGSSGAVAAWGIAMVGLFNVAGAYAAGVLGGRHSKKRLLAFVYFGRAAVITVFVAVPLSTGSVLLFGAAMGLLWLSTAPLTSGLVATFFGTRSMATLFGLVFLGHQVGSFLGVYLGGLLFERTGSYYAVWWACAALSVVAGLVTLPIREQAAPAITHPLRA